jgi:hypothetical protein
MSLVSQNIIKTQTLEPAFSTNVSCEFRISSNFQGKVLPNIRLIDIGASNSVGPLAYNKALGALSVIKNVYLYDGKQRLGSIIDAPSLLTFKMLNKSNTSNMSVNRELYKHSLGYKLSAEENGTQTTSEPTYGTNSTTSETTTAKAWVPLSELFPILSSLNHIDTMKQFKNLRLVIEWNNKVDDILQDVSGTPTMTFTRPRLIMDYFVNPMDAKPNGDRLNWMEMEQDRIYVDYSGATAASQTKTQRINTFNNKTVNRLIISKNYQSNAFNKTAGVIDGYGNAGSKTFNDEVFQTRLNGVNLEFQSGLQGNNRRLARLADEWGVMESFIGSNSSGLANNAVLLDVPSIASNIDYYTVNLAGAMVSDLQLTYSRAGVAKAASPQLFNEALVLRVMGEVVRELQFNKDGTYNLRNV